MIQEEGIFFSRWSCSFLKGYLEVSLPETFAQAFGKDDAETAGWVQEGCMRSWEENRFHSDPSDFIDWQLVSLPPGLI